MVKYRFLVYRENSILLYSWENIGFPFMMEYWFFVHGQNSILLFGGNIEFPL